MKEDIKDILMCLWILLLTVSAFGFPIYVAILVISALRKYIGS